MILQYLELLQWLYNASEKDRADAWDGLQEMIKLGTIDERGAELVEMAFEAVKNQQEREVEKDD